MCAQTITLIDGNAIPVLGLGTYKMRGEDAVVAIKRALRLGYTHIDTAEVYENEQEVGKAIKGIDRSSLFITSKLPFDRLGYEDTLLSCQSSLQRLGTDYIDLYLMHWPNSNFDMMETFRAFKQLLFDKKVRSIGVSNWEIKHFEKYLPLVKKLGIPIVTNQVECNPLISQEKLLSYCDEKGIVLTAYCPVARGQLDQEESLQQIATAHGKTAAQVALRWNIQRGLVVIPKAASEKHQKSNLAVFDFSLTDEEMQKILQANRNQRIVDWEGAEFS